MKPKIPTRRMREHSDLEQLKRQAKELLQGFVAGQKKAIAEVSAHYHHADAGNFALHDAQLVIARSYGFDSWPKLKAYVDGVTVKRFVDAVLANDLAQVEAMLKARPELATMAMSYADERRPIHFAVMSRLPQMTSLLMRQGADARAGVHPHRQATTAWTLAREREYAEIVAIIEQEEQRRGGTADRDENTEIVGDEAARAAVAAGNVEWLPARQAEGKFANPVRWRDGGLLTVAVEHNRPEILKLLLDFGFDPDEHVAGGQGDWTAYSQGSPLWQAAALGRREMAEILLQRGANPNAEVDSSGSAVYSAYSHKQFDMVELLRSHGGVVGSDTAAIYRQTDLIRQMLADDNRREFAEELLRFASSRGEPEIVRMVLERIDWPCDDPRWFGPLTEPRYFWHQIPWLYAGNRDFDRATYLTCFRLILERCDPNVGGSFGRAALHEIASMGDWVTEEEGVEFARVLLDSGARTDVRDELLQSTPLGWACRWGRAGVVRLMLERGADPVERDAEPWARPVAWAEKMGHPHIAALLLGAGSV